MRLRNAPFGRGSVLTLSTQRVLWQDHLRFFTNKSWAKGLNEVVSKSCILPIPDRSKGGGTEALQLPLGITRSISNIALYYGSTSTTLQPPSRLLNSLQTPFRPHSHPILTPFRPASGDSVLGLILR
eukprot:219685-Prorocentrum_minimum.AAC.1